VATSSTHPMHVLPAKTFLTAASSAQVRIRTCFLNAMNANMVNTLNQFTLGYYFEQDTWSCEKC
jgi:hypothetical protein